MFKVGDKVLPTKRLLLKLPHLADKLKDGGKILSIYKKTAVVEFYSRVIYSIYFSSLRPAMAKNQQLEFAFMDESYD